MSIKLGIRPYSKRELAGLYEMTPRCFFTMFKPHEEFVGKKLGRYYSVLQVEIIFKRLGLPPCMLNDKFEPKNSENQKQETTKTEKTNTQNLNESNLKKHENHRVQV